MNRGDAQVIALNITVDGQPIEKDYADELELTFNPELHGHSVRKTLQEGGIYWDDEDGKYYAAVDQADTFTLVPGVNTWQVRLLKDSMVMSTIIGKILIGDSNSKHVLSIGEE